MAYYIGVDLGGTKILTALAGEWGEIIARKKLPTEADKGTNRIIDNIYKTIRSVLGESDCRKDDVISIGVGSPGPLNTQEGIIYQNSNIPWKNVHLVDLLTEKCGLPVHLENDANAAALGEKYFGAGKGVDNLIYITVSTGIGGGIIIGGKIYHGQNDGAGEIGHMTIEPNGPLCGCGNYGCWETLASGKAIARMGREAVVQNHSRLLNKMSEGNLDKIDARMVARAAFKGDEMARRVYNKSGMYLGIGIANLINLFNPRMIILGGGVMKSNELFEKAMYRSLEKRVLKPSFEVVEFCGAELGSDTGVKGAIAVAMEKEQI